MIRGKMQPYACAAPVCGEDAAGVMIPVTYPIRTTAMLNVYPLTSKMLIEAFGARSVQMRQVYASLKCPVQEGWRVWIDDAPYDCVTRINFGRECSIVLERAVQ